MRIDQYKVGMIVYGKITGIKPYGAFVTFDDGITGLIHISELSNGFVRNINHFVKIDDYYMLKVIDIDYKHKQLRLSFKALEQNTRKYTRKVRFEGMPEMKIGFSSLKNKMKEWIKGETKC